MIWVCLMGVGVLDGVQDNRGAATIGTQCLGIPAGAGIIPVSPGQELKTPNYQCICFQNRRAGARGEGMPRFKDTCRLG